MTIFVIYLCGVVIATWLTEQVLYCQHSFSVNQYSDEDDGFIGLLILSWLDVIYLLLFWYEEIKWSLENRDNE